MTRLVPETPFSEQHAELRNHERMALELLSCGPDTVGVIDSDEKLAAAMVFADLKRRGLCALSLSPGGPTYHITPAGRAALLEVLGCSGEETRQ